MTTKIEVELPEPPPGFGWLKLPYRLSEEPFKKGDTFRREWVLERKHKEPVLLVYVKDPKTGDCETNLTDKTLEFWQRTKGTIELVGNYQGLDILKCKGLNVEWLFFGHWNDGPLPKEEPKESKEVSLEDRKCNNCKHGGVSSFESPCGRCLKCDPSNVELQWEPKT